LQTSAQAKPKKAKKAGADPVLEYERKAFRLEQMLEELREEMRTTGVETKDTQKVLDNLTDNLRTTQMQCQSLRNQRQKSASPAPSPAAAAASASAASAAASPSTPPPVAPQPRPPAQIQAAEPTTPTSTAAAPAATDAAAAAEEDVTPLAPPPTVCSPSLLHVALPNSVCSSRCHDGRTRESLRAHVVQQISTATGKSPAYIVRSRLIVAAALQCRASHPPYIPCSRQSLVSSAGCQAFL
jgi:hypothetical protein